MVFIFAALRCWLLVHSKHVWFCASRRRAVLGTFMFLIFLSPFSLSSFLSRLLLLRLMSSAKSLKQRKVKRFQPAPKFAAHTYKQHADLESSLPGVMRSYVNGVTFNIYGFLEGIWFDLSSVCKYTYVYERRRNKFWYCYFLAVCAKWVAAYRPMTFKN